MVEGQPKAPVPGIRDDRGPRIVRGLRLALAPGDEHRRNGVEPRVPRRVGVGVELAEEFDVERCLLAGLADGRLLERLAVVDETAGQGPAGGRVLALDEDDAARFPAVHDFDDDVDRRHGATELRATHSLSRLVTWPALPIVGADFSACQSENGDVSVFPERKTETSPFSAPFSLKCPLQEGQSLFQVSPDQDTFGRGGRAVKAG